MVPEKDGVTDAAALEEMLKADPQSACFYVQQPNYYGNVEDGDAWAVLSMRPAPSISWAAIPWL